MTVLVVMDKHKANLWATQWTWTKKVLSCFSLAPTLFRHPSVTGAPSIPKPWAQMPSSSRNVTRAHTSVSALSLCTLVLLANKVWHLPFTTARNKITSFLWIMSEVSSRSTPTKGLSGNAETFFLDTIRNDFYHFSNMAVVLMSNIL